MNVGTIAKRLQMPGVITAPVRNMGQELPVRPIPGWDAESIRAGLAKTRAGAITDIQQRIGKESKLMLQAGTHTQLLLQPTPTGKGTAVLLHGWSAGTWQYEELAPELFKQGYDVYIPRLPGHGFKKANGAHDPQFLPKSGESYAYTRFADQVYDDVKRLGGPIKLVGLSGGGAIALDIAARHDDVKATVAMAPFLTIPKLEKFGPIVDIIDKIWFGTGRSILNRIPYGWGKNEIKTPGHHEFKIGNVTGARRYGAEVGKRLPQGKVPAQIITTAIDRSASSTLITRWFKKGMPERSGWFEFKTADKVPHPMIAKANNPNDAARAQIRQMITQYLETGEPLQQPPERLR